MVDCQYCTFWQRYKSSKKGECRRYAPRPKYYNDVDLDKLVACMRVNAAADLMNTQIEVFWPITNQDDWCGEGKAS